MPKCKNDPTRNYKGNEPSPKGLGYCAHAEKLNKKKKGKDGNMWIVSETKKGIRRWIKENNKKNNTKTKTPQKIDKFSYWGFEDIKPNKIINFVKDNNLIMKIINDIVPKLKKKINFYKILLPPNQKNQYWSDYYSYYLDKYHKSWEDKEFIIITIFLNKDLSINEDEYIKLEYSLNLDNRKFIYDLFTKELPYNYKWNGLSTSIMKIYFKKQKGIPKKINIKPFKQFPYIYGYIFFKKLNKKDSLILYENSPFESKELKNIWQEINNKFNVVDFGWSSIELSFKIYDVNDIKLFKKIKKIKKLTIKNLTVNIEKIEIFYYKTIEDEEII